MMTGLQRRLRRTTSEAVRRGISAMMNPTPCPTCGGRRLRAESLAVRVAGSSIADWCAKSVAAARRDLGAVSFEGSHERIAAPILREITSRLGFLDDVGLGYLTLERSAGSLAGGEAQRIR